MYLKKFLTILLACATISCSQNTTHTGETHMGNYTAVTLEEDLNSPDVTATVEFIPPEDFNPAYTNLEFYVGDKYVGNFNNNILEFNPTEFGDIECRISCNNDDGMPAIVYHDTLKLYIETGYIQYNSSGENGDIKQPIEGGEVVLTPSNVTLGSSDMIWAYNVRVPKDGKITFDYESILLAGSKKLAVHFRLDDYVNRYDLYPNEPYVAKYIDAETDKWISAPAEFGHGIHTVYVCPNMQTGKNRISVIHSSDFSSGTFTANYASIIKWPND